MDGGHAPIHSTSTASRPRRSTSSLSHSYASTGPAAADLNISGDRDILPSQGWVLVVRDFGSAETPPTSLPYFILYNKYRGLLRLFYWSTLPVPRFDHAAASLLQQQYSGQDPAAPTTLPTPPT